MYTKDEKILVAIPAHNEAHSLPKVLTDIQNALSSTPHTIVVFDDASTDATQEIVSERNILSVRLGHRLGLGHVFSHITSYFLEGDFDILVTIDGDGQFCPDEIEKLVTTLRTQKAAMVTGSRFMDTSTTENISALKRFGNKLGARYISSVLKKNYYDVTCGFRAYSREAILRLHTFSDFTYTQEVFLNLGFKKLPILEVPIHTHYFSDRKSRMTHRVFRYIYKSLKIILKSMLIYSPMKLFGSLAALSLSVSLFAGVFVFFWNLSHDTVTPFKWLAIIAVVLGSLAVFFYCIGILLQITSRLQLTLEEQLYLTKRTTYGKK